STRRRDPGARFPRTISRRIAASSRSEIVSDMRFKVSKGYLQLIRARTRLLHPRLLQKWVERYSILYIILIVPRAQRWQGGCRRQNLREEIRMSVSNIQIPL